MNYEELKKKMDLEHFLENKKIIDKIFKNKEDNIDFINDFKKDLATRNNDILSIYFKLNYFPNDFKVDDDFVDCEISRMFPSKSYRAYDKKYVFIDELYKLIRKNNIELDEDIIKKMWLQYCNNIRKAKDINPSDFNSELYVYGKYLIDSEVLTNICKSYIDTYGINECLKKLDNIGNSPFEFARSIYEYSSKNNFSLTNYSEVEDIYNNCFSENKSKFTLIEIMTSINYIKNQNPKFDFNDCDNLKYGFIRYYIDKYGMNKAVELLNEKDFFKDFKKDIFVFFDYYNNDNLLSPMEKKELFGKIYENEIDNKKFKIIIKGAHLNSYNKEADICQILKRWGYGDCEMHEDLNNLNKQLVHVNQICDADSFYDSWAEKINEYNLSPLEKYFYVYYLCKNYKEYKFFDESEERDHTFYNISRNPYFILDNEYEVCAGYAAMTELLLGRLYDSRLSTFDLGVEQFNIAKQKMEYHARVGVYIEDTKYGIKSAYIGDPTFDSRNKERGLYKTNYMFMKFETIQSDGWKIFNVENNESFHKDKDLPYQEMDENTFISLATNVVYKTQKDLPDKAKRDMIVNFITDRYRKGDKFNKIGDIKNYFDKLTDNLPISDINVDSRINDIAVNFRCYDKKFIKDITQSGMYTVIDPERERVQFVLTSNNKKQVENVAFDLREKYDNLYDDNKNMPSARK